MSEQLLLINPRRRHRRHRKMSALQRKYFGRRRHHASRRRRRRHHVAGHYAVSRRGRRFRVRGHESNPRRRRRRKHHRRHYFRNPRFNMRGVVRETLIPAGVGAAGAIGLDIVYAYAQPYLPAMLQSGMLPILVKLAGAIGLGMAASKIAGRKTGEAVTLGAVTVVGYGAIKGALSTALPTIKGLSGYQDFVDYSVGAKPAGVGAYMGPSRGGVGFVNPAPMIGSPAAGSPGSLGSLAAYMGPTTGMHGLNAVGESGYDWRNDGM